MARDEPALCSRGGLAGVRLLDELVLYGKVDIGLGGKAKGELRVSVGVRHSKVAFTNDVHANQHITARNGSRFQNAVTMKRNLIWQADID